MWHSASCNSLTKQRWRADLLAGRFPEPPHLMRGDSITFPQWTRCPNTECNIARKGKKLGKKLWELISLLSNSWRAPGHGVSNLTKLPQSHWFYIPFGSRKSSKAFRFYFPSSAPLGGKIIQSKGFFVFHSGLGTISHFSTKFLF